MMLQGIWTGMMAVSLLYAVIFGTFGKMLEAALQGTAEAIALIVNLGAGYLFFCGMLEIVQALNVPMALVKRFGGGLKRLMPGIRSQQTLNAVALNLSANMLGLGNAATPMGMEAMRLMEHERQSRPEVAHDMYMLLVLNATSIQLLPTTVLALRVAAGSAAPNAVILPTLLCTAVSTACGALLAAAMRKAARHA